MQVARWGNSLAIRLPKVVVEALDLKEGDDVTLDVGGDRHLTVVRSQGRVELLERLKQFEGRLPADFKFDRLEASAR